MATSSNRPVIFNSDEHSAAAIVCADGGAGLGHAFYKRTCKKGREIERERKREKETERGTEKKTGSYLSPAKAVRIHLAGLAAAPVESHTGLTNFMDTFPTDKMQDLAAKQEHFCQTVPGLKARFRR